MDKEYYSIIEFNPKTAPKEILEDFCTLLDSVALESDKDYPLPTREARINQLKLPNPFDDEFWWLVRTNQNFIGYGFISFTTQNSPSYNIIKHLARMTIKILEGYRNDGIGIDLARILIKKAENYGNITTIQVKAFSESEKKFYEKLEGIVANESIVNHCPITNIDWELMNEWKKKGELLAKDEGLYLERFQKCPDDIIEEYCAVYTQINNQQPRGDSESRHIITPELRKYHEQQHQERNIVWITLIVRDKKKSIIGLTEIEYDKDTPLKIEQDLTGVLESHRGKGIAKWLKAEMLYIIKNEFSNIKYIRTGNAAKNKAMISINTKIGFKEHQKKTVYKFNIEQIKRKLKTL